MGKDKRNWSGREQNHHTSGLDAGTSGATFWTKMKIEPKTRDGTQEQSSAAAKSCGISDIRVRGRKRGGGGWDGMLDAID